MALNNLLGDPKVGRVLFKGMPTPASGAVTVEGLETFWGPELMQIGMKAMVAIKALGGVAVRCLQDEEHHGGAPVHPELLPGGGPVRAWGGEVHGSECPADPPSRTCQSGWATR